MSKGTVPDENVRYNERNQVEIRRRRMDATVLLVKALGGGWTTSDLPKLGELTDYLTFQMRSLLSAGLAF